MESVVCDDAGSVVWAAGGKGSAAAKKRRVAIGLISCFVAWSRACSMFGCTCIQCVLVRRSLDRSCPGQLRYRMLVLAYDPNIPRGCPLRVAVPPYIG